MGKDWKDRMDYIYGSNRLKQGIKTYKEPMLLYVYIVYEDATLGNSAALLDTMSVAKNARFHMSLMQYAFRPDFSSYIYVVNTYGPTTVKG